MQTPDSIESFDEGFPLKKIKNGYEFQQITAAFFRELVAGPLKRDFDVIVQENGIGPDGGFDILVEFIYSNVINKHSVRWVVECKCWESNLSPRDINFNKIKGSIEAQHADGYLLICKGNVTDTVKKNFRGWSNGSKIKYEIWEGHRFWEEINKCGTQLLQTFFTDYYREHYIDNNMKEKYDQIVERLKGEFQERQKKQ